MKKGIDYHICTIRESGVHTNEIEALEQVHKILRDNGIYLVHGKHHIEVVRHGNKQPIITLNNI